ncbi:50S ribosomal protein L18 [Rubellicoccus peritrichatus]|uniref:Large ribosomal subunit protein uL18 n=1 Tax=Rubellicoccus peritrichatus TaxID=3080537 RepID=A0AAQ3LJR4_9BACT|nr:50S ribosomal protein L18 [Puniceicoccus sp. CR14]WOO43504.1 50S ribosomal protein L18 [Puniceicoccus sp. CR14]
MKLQKKKLLVQKRRWRIRKTIRGTAERPRLTVYFSNKHIHAQCIDDVSGKTIAAANTTSKDVRDENLGPNIEGATKLGKALGEKAKAAGIDAVVFDRNGRRYHGCVKAFADAAREAGLRF